MGKGPQSGICLLPVPTAPTPSGLSTAAVCPARWPTAAATWAAPSAATPATSCSTAEVRKAGRAGDADDAQRFPALTFLVSPTPPPTFRSGYPVRGRLQNPEGRGQRDARPRE